MKTDKYTAPEVCAIAEITYRQLDYWDRIGFLRPSVREARGSGTQRIYSGRDVELAYSVRVLLDAGVSLPAIRAAIERRTLPEFVDQLSEAAARLLVWYRAEELEEAISA